MSIMGGLHGIINRSFTPTTTITNLLGRDGRANTQVMQTAPVVPLAAMDSMIITEERIVSLGLSGKRKNPNNEIPAAKSR